MMKMIMNQRVRNNYHFRDRVKKEAEIQKKAMNKELKIKSEIVFDLEDLYITHHQALFNADYIKTVHDGNSYLHFPKGKKYRFHAYVKKGKIRIHVDVFKTYERVGAHTTQVLPKLLEKEVKRISQINQDYGYISKRYHFE